MSSLFDQRTQYSSQFSFHQVDYHNRQQQIKTQDSSQTRWVVQPKGNNTQALYGEFIASNILHAPEVLRQLSFGVGQGVGTSYPLPQPGTTVTVLNVGNQKYTLGAQTLAPKPDFLYTLIRGKKYPTLPLPSALKPAITSAAGYVSTGALSSQPDLTELQFKREPVLMPASVKTTDPFTLVEQSISPISESAFINRRTVCSITPLSTITQQFLARQHLQDSAAVLTNATANDLYLINPSTGETQRVDQPTPARQQQFKLEVLTTIESHVQQALGLELGRKSAYPILYGLSKAAWTDPSLKAAFNLIALVEQDPNYLKVKAITDKINRYLPIAKKISNVLFPAQSNQLSVETFGVTANLDTLSIKPNYSAEIARFNKFLPVDLQLILNSDQTRLTLGSFSLTTNQSFVFSELFQTYVHQVNSYLPDDLDWIYGFGEPPLLLIICKGIAISTNLGLLIADAALDAAAISKQHLNCASADTTITPVTTAPDTAYFTNTNLSSSGSNSFLQTELFAAVPKLFQFNNGKLDIDRQGVAGLQQKILNAALPAGLQVALETNPSGYFSKINLGPLQAKRTSGTSWTLEIPNPTNLLGGLEVLETMGVIPPSLQFLREAVPQLASIYSEHKADFVDLLDGQDLIGDTLNKTLAKFKLDLSTGIKIEQLPPQLPEPTDYGPNPEAIWNKLTDVQQTTATAAFEDDTALRTFTKRPTLNGNFLPLLVYAEEQLTSGRNNQNTNDTLVKLGRSTSGVSIRDGTVPTSTGVNYTLLANLCANNSRLELPLETELVVADGFEQTKDNQATPPEVIVIGTIDPQSNRDALEAQLIETGLGDTATAALAALDVLFYPPQLKFNLTIYDPDVADNAVRYVDYLPEEVYRPEPDDPFFDQTERDLQPIDPDLNLSAVDLINVLQAVGDLGTKQVLAGILVAAIPAITPSTQVAQITQARLKYRLDCESLVPLDLSLGQLKSSSDFVNYAQEFGVKATPAITYLTQPVKLLQLTDQVEPRLSPALEQLLDGNLFGFFQQLIWAKTSADIYSSPLAYLALATNVRSYYGGPVSSSRPSREWLKEISK
jgi:hypothetical protein